jgi:hypothetical protein
MRSAFTVRRSPFSVHRFVAAPEVSCLIFKAGANRTDTSPTTMSLLRPFKAERQTANCER